MWVCQLGEIRDARFDLEGLYARATILALLQWRGGGAMRHWGRVDFWCASNWIMLVYRGMWRVSGCRLVAAADWSCTAEVDAWRCV